MSSDLALSIQGVGKTYRITRATTGATLASEVLIERLRHPLRRVPKDDFRALTDVSFDVGKGQAVGIIGRNGAGKSTLLKIISRIVAPTTGRIELYGQVGSLLEVGTGFHPELTGRENIYLNGAILGMKKRAIDTQFTSIVDFAEIGPFLETPVKRYSSGMYVRLAFAVAAHLNPEILLVDEVLAVGDAQFQRRCLGKMDAVSREEGRTVIFVSHNTTAIESLCPRCVYLEEGQVSFDGATRDAIEHYLSSAIPQDGAGDEPVDLAEALRTDSAHPILRRVQLRRVDGAPTRTIRMGEGLQIEVDVVDLSMPRHRFIVRILTDRELPVVTIPTTMKPLDFYEEGGAPERIVLRIPTLPLAPGRYWIDLFVEEGGFAKKKATIDHVERAAAFEVTPADVYGSGFTVPPHHRGLGFIYIDASWQVHRDGIVIAATSEGRP